MSLDASRVSRAEALARHLEMEVTAQSLAPGDRIGTKTQLRERFGVAVATINEAVRLLESRGLVAARPGPGGGVFVASAEDRARGGRMILGLERGRLTLRDCVELRAALEPTVYRQAARWSRPRDLRALDACVERMAAAVGDLEAYLRANWAFHRQAVSVCRNAALQSVYLAVLDILEAGLYDFAFDLDGYGPPSVDVHRELADAIADGHSPRLEAAIAAHALRSPLPS